MTQKTRWFHQWQTSAMMRMLMLAWYVLAQFTGTSAWDCMRSLWAILWNKDANTIVPRMTKPRLSGPGPTWWPLRPPGEYWSKQTWSTCSDSLAGVSLLRVSWPGSKSGDLVPQHVKWVLFKHFSPKIRTGPYVWGRAGPKGRGQMTSTIERKRTQKQEFSNAKPGVWRSRP